MILYPLLAENRRLERRQEWVALLKHTLHVSTVNDISTDELTGKFLEGTGSLVLDRRNKIAYATLSSRTHAAPLQQWCSHMKYEMISFTAETGEAKEIYHTNVLMAVGEKVAVLCTAVIHDEKEKQKVLSTLLKHQHVIEITEDQMNHFAGNLLLVKNRDGEKYWVLSLQAYRALTAAQRETLQLDGGFICNDLHTIETTGGGSARCMIAEIH